ncbi:uncharacterized protein TRIADDRAFT_58623 [Trichoplax adhaerens]|uniref:CUB domain-containing protein n=1 Tax=Trichoplax adhaerens TaxID=10228 RepID=B3S376_TRIAD|nr:hypothetical protein TRIADDRAFT_58623 [Trichoplax adhaerens]EDV22741.1 hypothetical protein TRIADDRAFT_58623 [Trichoplax adhaerens]|eukprot:XP_002114607.1 hypothetical protein TRIADDRAFT_58623 [Trichoplax adhaerens]
MGHTESASGMDCPFPISCKLYYYVVYFDTVYQWYKAMMKGTSVIPSVLYTAIVVLLGRLESLTEPKGRIVESPHHYQTNVNCSWLIESGTTNTTIRIELTEFATECSWDHLYVFDGRDSFAPLVASFSGIISPQTITNGIQSSVPTVVTNSGAAFLYFYSDQAYVTKGFNISYSMVTCIHGCSGNGVCIDNVNCLCDTGWTGSDCSSHVCSDGCSLVIDRSSRGFFCQCYKLVELVSLVAANSSDGYWKALITGMKETNEGRVSHTAVVNDGYMWVFGGYALKQTLLNDFIKFDLKDSIWSAVSPNSSYAMPSRRYGHSSVAYKDAIFIYGGQYDGKIFNELWIYNITSNIWSLIQNLKTNSCSPSKSREWNCITTYGSAVRGLYGHTSVYDSVTQKIYVHGGYLDRSLSAESGRLTDSLYAFDPSNHYWLV